MADGPNLFARLHKWATRQDENFLTETLAVVLEQLLVLSPEVGTRLVHQLTNGFLDVTADDASSIELQTQVEAGKGRPDLELRTPHRLVWIEVKAESTLRTGQLEGYRVLLGKSGVELTTQLILLTRYPEVFSPGDARPDEEIRWFKVADWFEKELPAAEASSMVAGFLVRQFLDFLRTRGMNLTQVGKYMPEGLRALQSLLNMLTEAARACKVLEINKQAGWEKVGLYLDDKKYWVGVALEDPERLRFQTDKACRIDPLAAKKLGVGSVIKKSWAPGGLIWRYLAELDSEEVHFYARSKVSQVEWLEKFLRDCLDKARSIETPNQPPIPDEPEGN